MNKRKRISRRILLSLVAFSMIILIFTSFFVGVNYYYKKISEYSDTAFLFARSLSRYIDGDRVLGYLEPVGTDENGDPVYQTDEYYDKVMEFLVTYQTEYELMKYYYVFVPYDDCLTYVWDAESVDDPSPIGYTEEYMDGGKEAVAKIFNSDPVEDIQIFPDDTYGFIACAFYPIYDSSGNPVAVAGVDLYMEDIIGEFLGYVLPIVGVIIISTLVAVVIAYILIRKSIVVPLQKLNKATKDLVENLDSDEISDLEIHTDDELEELAGSFGKMTMDLREYISKLSVVTSEKERIGAELNIATQIQADMLPRIFPAFPERSEFDLYASMDPAKEVGGDFYDFFLIDDDHLALVMADVSGKGVPAALFMVIAKTLIKNRAQLGESPARILNHVNHQLCEGNEAELFVTVWLAIIELSTGKGIAANAGHEHPVIRRAGGEYELVRYRHSPAVATIDGIRFREHTFELSPGDSIFVYTDGVPEATDSGNRMFGTERMLGCLNRDPSASPKELISAMKSDIDAFAGSAPQFDDITMLGFVYNGSKGKKDNELTIEARKENLEAVTEFVDGYLEKLECPMKAKMQIDIALEEIFVNISSYAYAPGTGVATVRVDTEDDPKSVTLTFTDSGIPYDPLAKEDPDVTLSAEERQIGGLGIYMVKKSMDGMEYEYRDGHNILRITKKLV